MNLEQRQIGSSFLCSEKKFDRILIISVQVKFFNVP